MTTLDSKIGRLLVRNGKLFGDCGCCDIIDVPDICPENVRPPYPFGINVSGTHSISFTPTSWSGFGVTSESATRFSALEWSFRMRWNLFSKFQFRFAFRPGTMAPVGIINELRARASCSSFLYPTGSAASVFFGQSTPGFAARQTFPSSPDINYQPFSLEGEVKTISINEITDLTGTYEYEVLNSSWSGTSRIDTKTSSGSISYSCARVCFFRVRLDALASRFIGDTVTPTIEGELDYSLRLVY